MSFELYADYQPAGDQPQAIEKLIDGLTSGLAHQTLLGRHRLRQDLHDRQRHPAPAAADAGARTQQDARRAALRRVQDLLPQERGRVLRFLLRLLPARGLCAGLGHLHREGRIDQRAHRADASVRDQGAAGAARFDHRRDRVGDLRPRRSRRRISAWCCTCRAATPWSSASCCGASPTCSTRATRSTCSRAPTACAATSSTSFRPSPSAKRCASSCSTIASRR